MWSCPLHREGAVNSLMPAANSDLEHAANSDLEHAANSDLEHAANSDLILRSIAVAAWRSQCVSKDGGKRRPHPARRYFAGRFSSLNRASCAHSSVTWK